MSWSGLPLEIEDRIIPEPMSGCWIWLGPFRDSKDYYGGLSYKGKVDRSHRFVYSYLRGPIPKGLLLDHLCRNKICCNPDHLEPATWATNIARGEGVAPKNLAKTHCPQGHGYTVENTYIWNKQRFCRACHYTHSMRYYKIRK